MKGGQHEEASVAAGQLRGPGTLTGGQYVQFS